MILHVSVTAEDIAAGDHNGSSCPLARAFGRAAEAAGMALNAYRCTVTHHSVRFYVESKPSNRRFELPAVAREWVRTYDLGTPVEPLTFDMEVPA